MKDWKNYITLINGLTAFILIISIISLSLHSRATSVQSVDVKKIVADFSSELAKSKVIDSKKTLLAKKFSQNLSGTLKAYAASHHVLLITPRAVVAGNADVTAKIEHSLNDKYRGK